MELPSKEDIIQAYQRVQPYINRTPIQTSSFIDQLVGGKIFFKCQNMQKTGAFKVRGAANKILQLTKPQRLCAHSSGNHAQAVSYMALRLGLKAYIVMPKGTPQVKVNAVKHYQAEVIQSGPTQKEQEQMSAKVAKEYNAEFIHPYNDIKIITGASTCAYELFQQYNDLDYLLVPIGGGGLSSGTVLSAKYFSPKTQVIGVQPYLARDAKDALEKGSVQPQYPPLTMAEGVRVNLGKVNFDILRKHLKEVVIVSEKQLIEAARMFMQRMKLVVQISGATVLAALLKQKERFRGKRVGAIISGGNIDLSYYYGHLMSKL